MEAALKQTVANKETLEKDLKELNVRYVDMYISIFVFAQVQYMHLIYPCQKSQG